MQVSRSTVASSVSTTPSPAVSAKAAATATAAVEDAAGSVDAVADEADAVGLTTVVDAAADAADVVDGEEDGRRMLDGAVVPVETLARVGSRTTSPLARRSRSTRGRAFRARLDSSRVLYHHAYFPALPFVAGSRRVIYSC